MSVLQPKMHLYFLYEPVRFGGYSFRFGSPKMHWLVLQVKLFIGLWNWDCGAPIFFLKAVFHCMLVYRCWAATPIVKLRTLHVLTS